jgi:hypothetical protein
MYLVLVYARSSTRLCRLVPVASASSQALPCKGMKFASPLRLSAQTPPPALQARRPPHMPNVSALAPRYDHPQLCRSTHARWMDTSIDLATTPVACLRTGSSPGRLSVFLPTPVHRSTADRLEGIPLPPLVNPSLHACLVDSWPRCLSCRPMVAPLVARSAC